MPVVGFLRSTLLAPFANLVTAFRQGLKEAGFVEGQNVAIECRYADNQIDRLPALVADLIRRPVLVTQDPKETCSEAPLDHLYCWIACAPLADDRPRCRHACTRTSRRLSAGMTRSASWFALAVSHESQK